MRNVYLNATEVCASPRLMRHLMGRMLELEEDGARLLGGRDPFAPREGALYVDFSSTMEHAKMTRLLAEQYHVFLSEEGGALRFSPADGTTFEDIDYAQGAVYHLLCQPSF